MLLYVYKLLAENKSLADEKIKSMWEFVSIKDMVAPPKYSSEHAKTLLSGVWKTFYDEDKDDSTDKVDVQTEIRSIPRALLDWVAPFPDWQQPASILYEKIKKWAKSDDPSNIFKVFVASPGGGAREILTKLAEQEKWPTVKFPSYEEILAGDMTWIDNIDKSNESPLVIPKLEEGFLRHHNGFKSLRKLIYTLFHYQQKCLIGCNSWLWRYLEQSMEIEDCFDEPMMLQYFTDSDLERFFCDLEKMNGKYTTVFRQTDNGEHILPVRETADGKIDEDLLAKDREEPAPFLKMLAVNSRGIPLVAWAMWRSSLNVALSDEVGDEAKNAALADKGHTIWVKPFNELTFPKMPELVQNKACFILQYLLIHDGLPSDILSELMKFEKDDLLGIIQKLRVSGIIVEERGLWRVSWLGYPAVRKFLRQEDYLIDALEE